MNSRRFAGGFLVGLGFAFVLWGIGDWLLVKGAIDALASWLEEQGYTMAPSGLTALDRIPILSMAIMVIGFICVLIGAIIAIRAKD